ncbi:ribosome small subunit-dependent GTPase A [Hazenella coriacea]|uniref:Small ribosomal subunit biogenesis GTPase RsgA n=1 Tax=Hazenella coriacea TaxID=1179467 RepID=A0A4R3L6B6_9BACL|nr:ribosome small subunit-dependent GTPase A [Hazenella coriacea]TCS94608.1 ribosome biogenesis GTPase [Hazenella coriacea]
MNLLSYGWNQQVEQFANETTSQGLEVGRILLEHKRLYRVMTKHGEVLAPVSGRFRYESLDRIDFPCVGDWVALTVQADEQKGTIHSIMPRGSQFTRKAAGTSNDVQLVATNVDTVFLVHALNQDFNLRRLERYLVMTWESGASPVIVLSKSDLCDDVEEKRNQVEAIAISAPIHVISAEFGVGLEKLYDYLKPGQTIALLGSSGVGKSTLSNKLIGKEHLAVQTIREQDGKGKHTTTHRELVPLPQGGCIIDTPGMRELQLWESDTGLDSTFQDIDVISKACRFMNCSHQNEPGCAVQVAIQEGSLTQERFASYLKLQRELAFFERKGNKRLQSEEKSRWKKQTKRYSQYKKHKNK